VGGRDSEEDNASAYSDGFSFVGDKLRLEGELKATRAAYVLISHDRAFLRTLTRATLWIDRGAVRRQEKGFSDFEDWRDKVWEDEDVQRHKLDRKIKAEARWAVEGISARRITISTVGLPEAIRELASQNRPYRLAVSLHAADDSVRSQLIPVNRNIGIAKIMAAADEYFQKTGRRLTFEYTLIGDINDGLDQARGLTTLLSGKTALVNLIPYNPVPGLPYHTPLPQQVQEFREILETAGISVQIRKRKGDKIEAACGQLRRANLETLSSISGV
jgi:hypothetical protein